MPSRLWGWGDVPSPRNQRGGGVHTRLRVRGWGSPNSDDWRESLVLCPLCGVYSSVSVEAIVKEGNFVIDV
jgi:hypothetical protein